MTIPIEEQIVAVRREFERAEDRLCEASGDVPKAACDNVLALKAALETLEAKLSMRTALVDLLQCIERGCNIDDDVCWRDHIAAAHRAVGLPAPPSPDAAGGEG